MPIVTSEQMLADAQSGRYAIGAFNAENMEMVLAIIETAEELCAPVIIQTTPSTVKYASTDAYAACVRAAARRASVPVCVHLDHGNSASLCEEAIESGYTSVMIDGSKEEFDKNVALTLKVADSARKKGIPVEAELGTVGGKEDGHEASTGCTLPDEALRFVRLTGVSSLAVAIGTAHGVYKAEPKLDIPRLKEIRALVDVPLVLHGASGLSDESIRACVAEGICKVNFATELRIAYTRGVREVLDADPSVFDPKAYGKVAREHIKAVVADRMRVCGCVGKAYKAKKEI